MIAMACPRCGTEDDCRTGLCAGCADAEDQRNDNALVKHAAADLPAVDPRPTCVECGATGPGVALALYCAGLAHLCAEHSAPPGGDR